VTLTRHYGILVPAATSSLCYLSLGLLVVRRAARLAGVPVSRVLWPVRQAS